MPSTFIMEVNGTGLSEWTASGGGTAAYTDVDNDNGDTEYAYVSGIASGKRLILDLAAPSVTEEDVASVDSVQIKASMSKTLGGNSYATLYQVGTAADSSAISNGSDTKTIIAGGYALYSGTAETTSDGSDAWVYGDLAGLQIRIDKFRNDRFGQLRLSYFYALVTYTGAVAADNATFFGANF